MHKIIIFFSGASHSDDLLYLFNMNLPVVMCDLNSFLVGLSVSWTQCILEVGLAESTKCLTNPEGAFKTNYGECLFGRLTDTEKELSDMMIEAWTSFATYGTPTKEGSFLPPLPTWSDDVPAFLRFGLSQSELAKLDGNYRKTYSNKPFTKSNNNKL